MRCSDMKKLQKLNMSVSVVIPKKDNDGKLMSNKVYESTLTLTDIVGGVSIQEMRGMWIEDGLFYQDDNELYKWSFSSENKQFETIIYAFMQLILDLIHHGKQYAVMIAINGIDYIFDRGVQIGDVEDVLMEVRDNA